MACERAACSEPTWEPTAVEVVAAVRSLYADEIKPAGRIIMKRLREHAAEGRGAAFANADAVPLVDPERLRVVCEACPELVVEQADGREYAALLSGECGCFVDACSLVDPYPMRLWEQATEYFENLDHEAGRLPCGRYACATELVARSAPFLAGRTLGEACHIVQLAISVRQLLGYADGRVVPYARSEKCAKARSAVRQQPMGAARHSGESSVPYATWEDVLRGLPMLLQRSRKPAHGVITVSNIKRLFRSELQLELSETALGHVRILELLRDERLRSVCWVQQAEHGQALVYGLLPDPLSLPPAVCTSPSNQGIFCTSMPSAAYGTPAQSTCASNRRPLAMPPASPTTAPSTFWLATSPSLAHSAWSGMPKAALVFHGIGKAESDTEAESHDTGSCISSCDHRALSACCEVGSLSSASAATQAPSEADADLSPAVRSQGVVVRNTFIHIAGEDTDSPRRRYSSVPRASRLARGDSA